MLDKITECNATLKLQKNTRLVILIFRNFSYIVHTLYLSTCVLSVNVRLIDHEFHQVSLGVEGSTMSGSLQRRKKSKRKWKRLWFLLKDKVLYTFTAREVRGHRVSHTSPKTLTHCQDHSITDTFPHNLCLLFFFHFTSGQYDAELLNSHFRCSTFPPGQNTSCD